MRVLAAAAITALLLTSCGGTVSGTPTAGGGDPTESTEPTETGEPTESTEPTEPTETSESDPGREALECEGENVISPEGQPFCFDLPEGFRQEEVDIENQAGSTASYSTGILLSERDLIVFSVYELSLDSDDLSDEELTDALAVVIDQLAAQGFDFTDTQPEISEIDGARSFYYTGADASGLRSDTYFIFRNSVELQVNCQWEEMEQEILAGCDEVLQSLQVSGST